MNLDRHRLLIAALLAFLLGFWLLLPFGFWLGRDSIWYTSATVTGIMLGIGGTAAVWFCLFDYFFKKHDP